MEQLLRVTEINHKSYGHTIKLKVKSDSALRE